jgi:hypothetical protein
VRDGIPCSRQLLSWAATVQHASAPSESDAEWNHLSEEISRDALIPHESFGKLYPDVSTQDGTQDGFSDQDLLEPSGILHKRMKLS